MKIIRVMLTLLFLLITNGCFLQPVNKIERETNLIDFTKEAVRLGQDVKVKILIKDKNKKWVRGGKCLLPYGAWVKGSKPKIEIEGE